MWRRLHLCRQREATAPWKLPSSEGEWCRRSWSAKDTGLPRGPLLPTPAPTLPGVSARSPETC